MKLKAILENVVSLDQRREQVAQQNKQRAARVKDNAMIGVDHAVAASIDELKRQGMSEREAYAAVMTHLSDLVMAHDLQGGMTE